MISTRVSASRAAILLSRERFVVGVDPRLPRGASVFLAMSVTQTLHHRIRDLCSRHRRDLSIFFRTGSVELARARGRLVVAVVRRRRRGCRILRAVGFHGMLRLIGSGMARATFDSAGVNGRFRHISPLTTVSCNMVNPDVPGAPMKTVFPRSVRVVEFVQHGDGPVRPRARRPRRRVIKSSRRRRPHAQIVASGAGFFRLTTAKEKIAVDLEPASRARDRAQSSRSGRLARNSAARWGSRFGTTSSKGQTRPRLLLPRVSRRAYEHRTALDESCDDGRSRVQTAAR